MIILYNFYDEIECYEVDEDGTPIIKYDEIECYEVDEDGTPIIKRKFIKIIIKLFVSLIFFLNFPFSILNFQFAALQRPRPPPQQ